MNQNDEQSAVERLRAADPAAGVEPDLGALRAEVDRRVAATPAPEVRRTAWTSWPARVAAVAASVLVVGGGGYAVGSMGDGGGGGSSSAAVISLGGTSAGAPEAMAGPAAAADSATSFARGGYGGYWGYWGRTVFTSSGLSTSGGTGQAWGFDAAGVYDEATFARVAAALGVQGTPTLQDGYWSVGSQDGTGPSLGMSPDGLASVYFYDPAVDPWSCVAALDGPAVMRDGAAAQEDAPEPAPDAEAPVDEGTAPDDGAGSDGETPGDAGSAGPGADTPGELTPEMLDPGLGVMPVEPCTQRDLGPAPQGDDAVAQVRDLIGALGWDPASFEVVTEESSEPTWSWVTAYLLVDGQRTGATWSFSFTGAGLQSFNAVLAPLVSLGDYEVISPAAAVERLGDPRFNAGGYPIAYTEVAMARESTTEMAPAPTVPSAPTPGAAIGWPVQQVTIVEARLGAAMHTQPDGATLLVPSYELTGDDGSIWSVIAVVDSQLDFTAGP